MTDRSDRYIDDGVNLLITLPTGEQLADRGEAPADGDDENALEDNKGS